MTSGRTGAPPPSGSGLGPNLPYVVTIVVSLVLLVAYLALGKPFTPSGGASGTSTTVVSATTTTLLGAITTIASGDTTTTLGGNAVALGEEIFNGTCIACHGVGAVGVAGLGPALTTSEFVAGLTDDELVTFLIVGRPTSDLANTTGIAMPPRGGNTSLTDDDLRAVVAYLRSIAEGSVTG